MMANKCPFKDIGTNFALFGLLILLMITMCRCAQLSSQELQNRYSRHLKTIRQFPCELPQPRSIRVADLLLNQLDTAENAQPHTTVLHRCDKGTGCCNEKSKECKVAEIEDIELHFLVTDSVRKKSGFKEFTVANHTKCSCQSMTNDIK